MAEFWSSFFFYHTDALVYVVNKKKKLYLTTITINPYIFVSLHLATIIMLTNILIRTKVSEEDRELKLLGRDYWNS